MYLDLIYNGQPETVFNIFTEDLRKAFRNSQNELVKIGLLAAESYELHKERIIPDDLYYKAIQIIYRHRF